MNKKLTKLLSVFLIAGLIGTGAAVGLTGCGGENNKPDNEQTGTTEYEVTFNANGHGTAPAKATTVNGKVTKPADLSETGWIFGGWYDNADCAGTAIDFATKTFSEATTLYAKWTDWRETIAGDYTMIVKDESGAVVLEKSEGFTVNKDGTFSFRYSYEEDENSDGTIQDTEKHVQLYNGNYEVKDGFIAGRVTSATIDGGHNESFPEHCDPENAMYMIAAYDEANKLMIIYGEEENVGNLGYGETVYVLEESLNNGVITDAIKAVFADVGRDALKIKSGKYVCKDYMYELVVDKAEMKAVLSNGSDDPITLEIQEDEDGSLYAENGEGDSYVKFTIEIRSYGYYVVANGSVPMNFVPAPEDYELDVEDLAGVYAGETVISDMGTSYKVSGVTILANGQIQLTAVKCNAQGVVAEGAEAFTLCSKLVSVDKYNCANDQGYFHVEAMDKAVNSIKFYYGYDESAAVEFTKDAQAAPSVPLDAIAEGTYKSEDGSVVLKVKADGARLNDTAAYIVGGNATDGVRVAAFDSNYDHVDYIVKILESGALKVLKLDGTTEVATLNPHIVNYDTLKVDGTSVTSDNFEISYKHWYKVAATGWYKVTLEEGDPGEVYYNVEDPEEPSWQNNFYTSMDGTIIHLVADTYFGIAGSEKYVGGEWVFVGSTFKVEATEAPKGYTEEAPILLTDTVTAGTINGPKNTEDYYFSFTSAAGGNFVIATTNEDYQCVTFIINGKAYGYAMGADGWTPEVNAGGKTCAITLAAGETVKIVANCKSVNYVSAQELDITIYEDFASGATKLDLSTPKQITADGKYVVEEVGSTATGVTFTSTAMFTVQATGKYENQASEIDGGFVVVMAPEDLLDGFKVSGATAAITVTLNKFEGFTEEQQGVYEYEATDYDGKIAITVTIGADTVTYNGSNYEDVTLAFAGVEGDTIKYSYEGEYGKLYLSITFGSNYVTFNDQLAGGWMDYEVDWAGETPAATSATV